MTQFTDLKDWAFSVAGYFADQIADRAIEPRAALDIVEPADNHSDDLTEYAFEPECVQRLFERGELGLRALDEKNPSGIIRAIPGKTDGRPNFAYGITWKEAEAAGYLNEPVNCKPLDQLF